MPHITWVSHIPYHHLIFLTWLSVSSIRADDLFINVGIFFIRAALSHFFSPLLACYCQLRPPPLCPPPPLPPPTSSPPSPPLYHLFLLLPSSPPRRSSRLYAKTNNGKKLVNAQKDTSSASTHSPHAVASASPRVLSPQTSIVRLVLAAPPGPRANRGRERRPSYRRARRLRPKACAS